MEAATFVIPGPAGRTLAAGHGESNEGDHYFLQPQSWVSSLDSLCEETKYIIRKNTICEVKRQAKKGTLPDEKVEWLRVVVDEVQREDVMHNGTMTVKDPSGEIKCVVHREIMDHYDNSLHPGSVLILKQVSVPCFNRHSPKSNCYLNIVKENLYGIYSDKKKEQY